LTRPVVQSQNEAASVRDEQHSLSRREFDAAISDFNALGRDVQVTQVADGVRVDEVAASSLPYRMGIRAGDVVLDVDGKKIRTMNDAAAVYARLMDADRFSVKVKRGAGVITLRYQFTR
jgi:S1-C subfamily serine protease